MKNALIVGLIILVVVAGAIGLTYKPSAPGEVPTALAPVNEVAPTVPGGLDLPDTPDTADAALNQPSSAGPGFYSEQEYAVFKSEYNCELARNVRLQCESVDRGEAGNEQCLKLSQYYTYSRHCGSEP